MPEGSVHVDAYNGAIWLWWMMSVILCLNVQLLNSLDIQAAFVTHGSGREHAGIYASAGPEECGQICVGLL